MRLTRFGLLAATLLSAGCAGFLDGGPAALREPGFRPSAIRKPALLVRVWVSRDFSARDRERIPGEYQGAVEEALGRLGFVPVDTAFVTGSGQRPLEGLDRVPPLARAREAGADHLVIVDARLTRADVTVCRDEKRPLTGVATFWDAGLEVDRASDGRPMLIEPAAGDRRAVEVEVNCRTGRVDRRKSLSDLVEESVGIVLEPFQPR